MTRKRLGKEIEKAIIENEISYRQIREITGLNHTQVKQLIDGEPKLTVPKLFDLMKMLNIKFAGIVDV